MSNNTAAAAKAGGIDAGEVGDHASELVRSSVDWASAYWLQIAIAIGIGAVISLSLIWLRSLGPRLARRSASGKGWAAILVRAIARTGTFFIVMLSARLVAGYAGAPPNVAVNVTGLVAGLGVGGIAIGLAAQGIFADLFAALAIIFDRPFRRGDAVSYDQTSGTVEEIGLKSTRVRGVNGEERIISNKQLLDKEIQNNTRRERRRIKFTLGLAYETPVEKLDAFPAMMKETIEASGMVFVRCGLLQFGASSLDFDIEFDSNSPDFQTAFDGRHKTGIAILKRCNDEGLVIPYPTQTTYTAAPDGRFIMPYSEHLHLSPAGGE